MISMLAFTSCDKPRYDCHCISTTTEDSFMEVSDENHNELEAADWCGSIQTNNQGYNCTVFSTYK